MEVEEDVKTPKEDAETAKPAPEPKEKTHRHHRNEGGENQAPKPVVEAVEVKDEVEEETKKAEVFSGTSFSELPISDKLKETLAHHGFNELTQI